MPLNEEKLAKERSYFVAKDNALITKSRYGLSLQQQKILLYFISRIKPTDEENTLYELSIKDFASVCGYTNDSGYYYQSIKADIKKLRDVSSWIEISPGKEVLFSWIDTAEINRKQGIIKVSFHETVAPYLFELQERYTSYSLFNVLTLTHKYSIRLYEYLCANKFRTVFEVPVEDLKKRLDAENYKIFANFRERVLEPAVLDIDEMTDIFVEYAFKKTGRAITHIIFRFVDKTKHQQAARFYKQERQIDPKRRKEHKEMMKKIFALTAKNQIENHDKKNDG